MISEVLVWRFMRSRTNCWSWQAHLLWQVAKYECELFETKKDWLRELDEATLGLCTSLSPLELSESEILDSVLVSLSVYLKFFDCSIIFMKVHILSEIWLVCSCVVIVYYIHILSVTRID
jgi:hypothetical protein